MTPQQVNDHNQGLDGLIVDPGQRNVLEDLQQALDYYLVDILGVRDSDLCLGCFHRRGWEFVVRFHQDDYWLLCGYSKGYEVLVVVPELVYGVIVSFLFDLLPLVLQEIARGFIFIVEVYDPLITSLIIHLAQHLVLELVYRSQTPKYLQQVSSAVIINLRLQKIDNEIPEPWEFAVRKNNEPTVLDHRDESVDGYISSAVVEFVLHGFNDMLGDGVNVGEG